MKTMQHTAFKQAESLLKRSLKGKVSITRALVIGFLMTGLVSVGGGQVANAAAPAEATAAPIAGITDAANNTLNATFANDSVGIGIGATVNNGDVVLGTDATSTGANGVDEKTYNIVIGREAKVENVPFGTAIGYQSAVSGGGQNGTAVGYQANVTGPNSTAIGYLASASGGTSMALGFQAQSTGPMSVAIGNATAKKKVTASGTSAVAVGTDSTASANYSLALGSSANANVTDYTGTSTNIGSSIAIGNTAGASSDRAVALGGATKATGERATALGTGARATHNRSLAAGNAATASSDFGVALGSTATVNKGENNVALGSGAVDKEKVQVSEAAVTVADGGTFTYGATTGYNFAGTANAVVSVGDAGKERQIVNVAPGAINASSTDAINGSQLYAVAQRVERGWDIADNDGNTVTYVNPTKKVSFINGDFTTATVKPGDDGNPSVKYDVTTKAPTVNTAAAGATDAEQLAAKIGGVTAPQDNGVVTATDLTSVLTNGGWSTNATGNNITTGADTNRAVIGFGKAVDFAAGKNMEINRAVTNGNVTYTYATKKDVQFDKVTVGGKENPADSGKYTGGIVIGNQTTNDVKGGQETGNFVSGLDNKTWTPDHITSGRAATEDQLKSVSDAVAQGWDIVGNDGIKVTSVTPGKKVAFKNGNLTTATVEVDPATGNPAVKYDVTTKAPTVNTAAPGATDADQLAAKIGGVTAPQNNGVVTATDLTSVLTNGGWSTNATGGLADGTTASRTVIGFGKAVDFAAGKNMEITQNVDNTTGNVTYTYATKKDVQFDKVTVGGTEDPADSGKYTGGIVIGNQDIPKTDTDGQPVIGADGKPEVKETGNYITGLDNKTWDPNDITSGRAATEDQLKAVSDAIAGGWEIAGNDGKPVTNVAPGKTVAFKNGNLTTATVEPGDDGNPSVKYDVTTAAPTVNTAAPGATDEEQLAAKIGGVTAPTVTKDDGTVETVNGVVTAADLADVLTNGGWNTNATGDNITTNADTNRAVIGFGKAVDFAAGKNMEIDRAVDTDGNVTYTYATKKDVQFDKVTVGGTEDPADSGKYTGGIVIGNQEAAKVDKDGKPVVGEDGKPITEKGDYITGLDNKDWNPDAITSGRAATEDQLKVVSDAVAGGWEIAGNDGKPVTNVAPGKTVAFKNGNLTTATVEADDAGNPSVKYDVTTAAPTVNTAAAGATDEEQLAAKIGGVTVPTRKDEQGNPIKDNDGKDVPDNGVVTAVDLADILTNGGWNTNATGGLADGTTASRTVIGFGKAVDFAAGKNMEITQDVDKNGNVTYTYATKKDVQFDKVTVGGTENTADGTYTGGIVIGNQETEKVNPDNDGNPIKEQGNFITGLDNKDWDQDNITSGRAATEDQLQQAIDNITKGTGTGATGGFGLKDSEGQTVTQDLGKQISIIGNTKKVDGKDVTNVKTTVGTDADGNPALKIDLNNEINLNTGDKKDGSITAGNTTINEGGIDTNKVTVGADDKGNGGIVIGNQEITKTDKDGQPVIGADGKPEVKETGNYITGLDNKTWNPDDITSGRAATEDQLKQLSDNVDTKINDAKTLVTVNGKDVKYDTDADGKGTGEFGDAVTSGNLTVKAKEDSKTGQLTYDFKLANTIAIGEGPTKDDNGNITKEGEAGNITINNKAGDTTIKMDGETGTISIPGAKGADGKPGKDAVSISGKDGVGHIGLTGPKGADGKDGASIDISTDKGQATLDSSKNNPANGNNPATADRIIYTSPDGEIKHEVATMDDGLTFKGDNDKVIVKKLNERLDIVGGAKGELTDGNIGVNPTEDGKLSVQLAKNIDLTENGSIKMGETVINNGGLTIKNSTNPDNNVVINGDKISMGGNRIENVATGVVGTDAVNVKQLHDEIGGAVNPLREEMYDVGASAAALGALKPLQYDPLEPTQIMVGYGNYRGSSALAMGVAHYKNESTMFHAGMSWAGGSSHMMANAGITWKVGSRDSETAVADRYRKGPISSAYAMQNEMAAMKAQNAGLKGEVADLKAENEQMKAQIAAMMAKLGL